MKTIICITLIFQLFVSISASANTCTPTVSKGNVMVEVINGDGKTVYSEQHQVRNEKKYSGLISSSKIYNLLKHDKSGKIKVDKTKFKLTAGGMTTKATKKDRSAIAKIGGCPISEVTLFTRLGKQKEPFVHTDLIQIASKSTGLKIAGNDKPINKTKNIPVKSKSITNNSASKPVSKDALSLLLGKWSTDVGAIEIEFLSDGRFLFTKKKAQGESAEIFTGSWVVLDDGRVKIDLNFFGELEHLTGTLQGDTLALLFDKGDIIEFKKTPL